MTLAQLDILCRPEGSSAALPAEGTAADLFAFAGGRLNG